MEPGPTGKKKGVPMLLQERGAAVKKKVGGDLHKKREINIDQDNAKGGPNGPSEKREKETLHRPYKTPKMGMCEGRQKGMGGKERWGGGRLIFFAIEKGTRKIGMERGGEGRQRSPLMCVKRGGGSSALGRWGVRRLEGSGGRKGDHQQRA